MRKSCDVLYIHSTKNPIGVNNMKYPIMPMGIIGVLNNLRARGIQVMGLNFAIEKSLNPQFDILTTLENIDYKVLLTDLHWYEHSFGALYIAEQSKKLHPHTPTVLGGYTSTIFANEIMENFPQVDYIVTGDSDLPVERLVDELLGNADSPDTIPNLVYRRDGFVLTSREIWAQTDLDAIDFIHTDCFEHSQYIPYLTVKGLTRKASSYWLCIARGCKFNCAYCCGANANMETLFHRCNVLTRSPERVASDFCQLTEMGISRVSPSHDFQMLGKDYYQKVFSQIRKANVKPGMYLECFQLPTKEYIDDIARTFDKKNLILVISPISGNEILRRENGKFFTNEALVDMVAYAMAKGIVVQLYYTLNIVGETRQQFMDTYIQMKYLHILLGLGRKSILYQRVVIDPLAGMRKMEGIEVKYNDFMDYYHYCLLADEEKYSATGFEDRGEVPLMEKIRMYEGIFSQDTACLD